MGGHDAVLALVLGASLGDPRGALLPMMPNEAESSFHQPRVEDPDSMC
jgi:hypothetical protein